ncbi:MAG: nucleotidyltransferase domain-containing protein [Coriobacteriales bacterium]|jgi:predicted nucleotidyltransferase|nr:nucleotidyltransferase domain-containing protein [Coriobacteriales bacterium]
MRDTTYTLQDLTRIVTPLAKEYGIEHVYLFGSYARNSQTASSDIDFRIDATGITTLFELGGFYSDLQDHIDVPIDVLTTEALSEDFLERIHDEEVLLYTASDS